MNKLSVVARTFVVGVVFALLSCGENDKGKATEKQELSSAPNDDSTHVEGMSTNIMKGYYVGEFKAEVVNIYKSPSYSNKINLSIDTVWGKNVEGHSVVAGNLRAFRGHFTNQTDTTITVKATEPGDDKYDGYFEFTWNKIKNSIAGKWVANDTSLAVAERKYTLEYKEFSYNPDYELEKTTTLLSDEYWDVDVNGEVVSENAAKFNASVVELKKEDIENMSATDLELMRNAIYARHGYSFKNRKMRYYFDRYEDWYIPVSVDIRKDLTPLEKKNIDLIKRYEEHAQRYYDSYGR